jgi:hypothetical protein
MRCTLHLVVLVTMIRTMTAGATPEGIPIQYMDSHGRTPAVSAAEYMDSRLSEAYRVRIITPVDALAGKVILIVEERIFDGIAASLATFQTDLEGEGYTVETWQVSGGSASDIRSDLQTAFLAGGLDGALLIGDIPTGWMDNGFGEYPIDLFLMDMNGTWNDPDGDGLYESYSDAAPEIWVGRLTPTFLTWGSSAELINGYFARNHAYRTGTLSLPDRALAYEEAFTGLTYNLDNLYPTVVRVTDPVGTNADDFKQELLTSYEWVHLISHSSPWGSSFHTGAPPEGGGTLENFEVPPLDPHAFFYVLNCCSNGRWTEVDNLANSYIWCDTYGLAALAQTKVDYTNYFTEYYNELAAGSNLGDAFRVWLSGNMYYENGAVLFGDPTLKPRQSGNIASTCEQGGYGTGRDTWSQYPVTEGLHTQGRVDTYTDPATGQVFAVSGTSDPVRANILATYAAGDLWAEPVIVCQHEYWDWHPTVGGDGTGNVWTAWQSMHENIEGYDIFVSKWSGSYWETETQLTTGDPFEVEPALAGGGGHAWLVWQKWDTGETDIEGRFWTGSQWTEIETASSEPGSERYPDVTYGTGGFGLVYQSLRNDQWSICFRDAPDSGPFGTETVLSDPSDESRYASIASDPEGYFWVVWQRQNGGIMCTHQDGSGWIAPILISGTDNGVRPSIAVDSYGNAAAAWTTGIDAINVNYCLAGIWSGVQPAVTADAVDDVSLAFAGDDRLWAVYGRRDTDLQWDLWVATTTAQGSGEGQSSTVQPGIRLAGGNPFTTAIAVKIEVADEGILEIFDLSGRMIKCQHIESGIHIWEGTDQHGQNVPSGIYLLRLTDGVNAYICRVVKLVD